MHELVIADSSCLILLLKIGELDLLRLNYSKVYITKEIQDEVEQRLPEWIEVKEIQDQNLKAVFEQKLDLGEATAITLAHEMQNVTIILDDAKARKVAQRMGLKITGTVGVILKAKQRNTIPAVKPIFEKISKTDFRISDQIIKAALEAAGEAP